MPAVEFVGSRRPLLLGPPLLVEPGEVGVGHVDLAADLEQGGGGSSQRSGMLADGLQVVRDVVAALAVAAGGAQDELAIS